MNNEPQAPHSASSADGETADQPPIYPASGVWRVPNWLRWLALVVALALFLGALAMVWRQRHVVREAIEAIDGPAPALIALLLGSILASLILSATTFHLLIRRYGRVEWLEMQALVAMSGLLNFLPLRPGMIGRIAYHRQVNRIPILHTSRTVIEAAALSAAAAACLAGAAGLSLWLGANLWLAVSVPVGALVIGLIVPGVRLWAVCGLLRFADVMLWSLRYHAAFGLLGSPLTWEAAVAFAGISTIATMVPLISNGLGLREWAVGLLSPLLTSYQLTLGLTAELINRAGEIIVIVIVGAGAMLWLAPRWKRAAQQ